MFLSLWFFASGATFIGYRSKARMLDQQVAQAIVAIDDQVKKEMETKAKMPSPWAILPLGAPEGGIFNKP